MRMRAFPLKPRHVAGVMALVVGVILPVIVAIGIAPPPSGPGQKPMPDFAAIDDVDTRKQRFFAYLRPVVEAANAEIRHQRERLLAIAARYRAAGRLPGRDRRWLRAMAERYDISADTIGDWIDALRPRMDIVPPSLALAQAAIESGWGRSRFARAGNNLFGEWCYREGCGFVPSARPQGATYEVRAFASVGMAVRGYLHNLNTHRAYRELRERRARLRAEGESPRGLALAAHLGRYSERGQAYVEQVRGVIRGNGLE